MDMLQKVLQKIPKQFYIPLIIAIVGNLILAFATFQKDAYYVALFTSHFIQGDFDFYSSVRDLTNINLRPYDLSIFPPMAQIIDSITYAPFYFLQIYPNNLDTWQSVIATPTNYTSFVPWLAFLLKLRYLIVFFLSIYIMQKIANLVTPKKHLRNAIVTLWILCPIATYSIFMQGNNDIYPTVFLLLYILFAFKRHYIIASICLGLAAATKNFAIFLFLPSAIIFGQKEFKKTLLYAAIPCVVYIVPVLFYIKYSYHFLTAGNESFYIFKYKLFDVVLLFPLLYLLINLYLFFQHTRESLSKNANELIVRYFFLILSLFFIAAYFHPQWVLWVMPFFILHIYQSSRRFALYVLLCCAFFILIFIQWAKNLDFTLFSSIFPILAYVESFDRFVAARFHDLSIMAYPWTLFYGIYGYIIFDVLKNKVDSKTFIPPKRIYLSILPIFFFITLNAGYVLSYTTVHNRYAEDLGLEFQKSTDVIPITSTSSFRQTFTATKDNLKGLTVFMKYYETPDFSTYALVLYKENCTEEIRNVLLNPDKVRNDYYTEVLFDPIKDSDGQQYCFSVRSTTTDVRKAFYGVITQPHAYKLGKLILNDTLSNQSIVFQPIYSIK